MVRIAGLSYTCEPATLAGQRISDLRLGDKPLDAARTYKVAGWASVAENVQGRAIWDVVAAYLCAHPTLAAPKLNLPLLRGVEGNPGLV